MRLTLVTPPVSEPFTLAEAKAHLRVTHDNEDTLITALLTAAAGVIEQRTERQLITATWKLTLDAFPYWEPYTGPAYPFWGEWMYGRYGAIEVPRAPLQAITSIKYLDTAGAEQTWSSAEYVVDIPTGPYASPARIAPAIGKTYPATAALPGAVRVEFTAGYGTTEVTVPEELRQAMLFLVMHWYVNRTPVNVGNITNELPMTLDALLAPFVRWRAAFA